MYIYICIYVPYTNITDEERLREREREGEGERERERERERLQNVLGEIQLFGVRGKLTTKLLPKIRPVI